MKSNKLQQVLGWVNNIRVNKLGLGTISMLPTGWVGDSAKCVIANAFTMESDGKKVYANVAELSLITVAGTDGVNRSFEINHPNLVNELIQSFDDRKMLEYIIEDDMNPCESDWLKAYYTGDSVHLLPSDVKHGALSDMAPDWAKLALERGECVMGSDSTLKTQSWELAYSIDEFGEQDYCEAGRYLGESVT